MKELLGRTHRDKNELTKESEKKLMEGRWTVEKVYGVLGTK